MMGVSGVGPKKREGNPLRLCCCLLAFVLAGCEATPRQDIDAASSRLTGIDNAIFFHDSDASPIASVTTVPVPSDVPGHLAAARAMRLALENDPHIAIALDHVRAAEADARQARLLPNPVLSVDFRFPEGAMGPLAVEVIPTEDVIAILQKPQQASAADNRLRQSAADALTTVLDVVQQVQETYVSAQSADQEIAGSQERGQILARLRDLAEKRLSAGEGTRLDVLTLEAQELQLQSDDDDLRLERTHQRLTLTRLIGQPRGPADWELDAPPPAPARAANESAWIDAALANRPEILSRLWELRALGDDLKLTDLAPLTPDSVGAYAQRDPKWSVGPIINVPVPIFDFGQETRAKAVAERQAARHELVQQCSEVIEDVRSAYASFVASQQALAHAQDQLLPVEQNLRQQAELAYESGDSDLAATLNAETELRQTREKLVELQENVTLALVRLQRAAGGAGIATTIESAAAATLPSAVPAPAPATSATESTP
jgi:outer membrane protein TolC